MTNNRLLFVYTRLSTFVKCDLDILENEHRVTTFGVDNTAKGKQLMAMIRLFFYLSFNIYRFDTIYIWFADYHSFLPILFAKIFGKKSYLVIGGYDVCRIKKYKYGSFVNPVRGFMTKFSMNNATLNLCVSRHLARIVKAIAKKSKQTVLYNGVAFSSGDPAQVEYKGYNTKQEHNTNSVLSVALSSTSQSFYIKGIDRFIEAAKAAPDIDFILIGADKERLSDLTKGLPVNLKVLSRVDHKELIKYYEQATVYCQLSRSESFGVSLAEAMYYNCIPVITYAGGMPEVAGEYGFIVDGRNTDETVSAIRAALETKYNNELRKRIEDQFSLKIRAEAIKGIVK